MLKHLSFGCKFIASAVFLLPALGFQSASAQSDARTELWGRLGGSIIQAKKFIISGATYYAVVSRPYLNGDITMSVYKLSGQAYLKIFSRGVDWTGDLPKDIQVLDLNKDQKVEFFYHQTSCGSGGCFDTYYLINTADKRVYYGPVFGDVVEYDDSLMSDKNKPFLDYFIRKLKPIEYEDEGEDRLGAADWMFKHMAFSDGKILSTKITPKYAPISDCSTEKGTIVSSVWIGDIKYVSQFKGNVFGINYKKSTCFIVFIPKDSYEWIGSLKSNKDILIMTDRADGSIVGKFNTKTFELYR